MNRWPLCLLFLLSFVCGCTATLRIVNHGPNPIQVTANPSPDTPPLPLTIPVDPEIPPPHRLTWEGIFGTSIDVEVTAVDTVTFASKTQTITVNAQDSFGGSETVIEWNGTEFFHP